MNNSGKSRAPVEVKTAGIGFQTPTIVCASCGRRQSKGQYKGSPVCITCKPPVVA